MPDERLGTCSRLVQAVQDAFADKAKCKRCGDTHEMEGGTMPGAIRCSDCSPRHDAKPLLPASESAAREEQRQRFEAAAIECDIDVERVGEDYLDAEASAAWRGWSMAVFEMERRLKGQ